jgi:hypothetical protein
MGKSDWTVPKTEDGLQEVLRRIESSRQAGDDVETGLGLLSLSHLVKWVRSDTDANPMERSRELALEALELFRRIHHKAGQIRALVAALPFSSPLEREEMLEQADALAEGVDDKNCLAMVLAARSRMIALSDFPRAVVLQRQALEIYRALGNLQGQARCLFSLSIYVDVAEEKRDAALESARLSRQLGDPADASRAVTIALMSATSLQPLESMEPIVRQGLQDAIAAQDSGQQAWFYSKLAQIATIQNDPERATFFQALSAKHSNPDGMTPLEKWQFDVGMLTALLEMTTRQESPKAQEMFRTSLEQLKANKPE